MRGGCRQGDTTQSAKSARATGCGWGLHTVGPPIPSRAADPAITAGHQGELGRCVSSQRTVPWLALLIAARLPDPTTPAALAAAARPSGRRFRRPPPDWLRGHPRRRPGRAAGADGLPGRGGGRGVRQPGRRPTVSVAHAGGLRTSPNQCAPRSRQVEIGPEAPRDCWRPGIRAVGRGVPALGAMRGPAARRLRRSAPACWPPPGQTQAAGGRFKPSIDWS